MDDETIEQTIRAKSLLTDEQIESVHQAIRDAAAADEELAFLDAAVKLNMISAEESARIQADADKEISSAETGEIVGEIAEDDQETKTDVSAIEQPDGKADEAAQQACNTGEAPSEDSNKSKDESEAACAECCQPSSEAVSGDAKPAAKPLPIVPMIAVAALLIALIIIVAIMNPAG